MTATQFSAPVSPRAGVTHVRHRHESGFTVVGNHLAQHEELSATAIGIGVYIHSLPDGVRVGIAQLVDRFSEGEVRVTRALRELEAAGYLERRRMRGPDGQCVTRTTWYEMPDAEPAAATAEPAPEPEPVPAPVQEQEPVPEPEGESSDPLASELLAGLRQRDARLLLSARDVHRLAPAVGTWLDRGVDPEQIARTLAGDLPVGIIRRPAGLLRHRLTEWLPPALADVVATRTDPLQNCDRCDRAYRAAEPGVCRPCATECAA